MLEWNHIQGTEDEWVAHHDEGLCQILRSKDGTKYLLSTPWGQAEFASFQDAVDELDAVIEEGCE